MAEDRWKIEIVRCRTSQAEFRKEDQHMSSAIYKKKKLKEKPDLQKAETTYMQEKVQTRHKSPGRCYSEATQRFIEAQRAAKLKHLVEKEVQKAEAAQVQKQMDRVAQQVRWQPKHCRRCGHDQGCMCPREPKLEKQLCEHASLIRVPLNIAQELEPTIKHGVGLVFYACQHCHHLVLMLPNGQLRP